MMGRRPYDGRSRREIRNQILAKQAYVRQEMIPRGWSVEAADFINRLIQRKPYKRLGKQGIHELRHHNWFKNFDWEGLENKTMKPPFVPNIKNVFEYLRNLTEDFTEVECSMENSLLVRKDSFQNLFSGYECFPQNEPKQAIMTSKVNMVETKARDRNSHRTSPKVDSTKLTTRGDPRPTSKDGRLSAKKVVADKTRVVGKSRASGSRGKKRISHRKETGEQSKVGTKSICGPKNVKKGTGKKKGVKKVSSDLLRSKQLSKTLKKNCVVGKEAKQGKPERKTGKQKQELSKSNWKMKDLSKMGILGQPSSKWEKGSEQSRNVRQLIKKRTALNRSLCKKNKKRQSGGESEKRVNQSMNPEMGEAKRGLLGKSRQKSAKNDLKGYLSLNSKQFFDKVRRSKEKKLGSSFKKNSKILKLKNPRKMGVGRGYYVSPQFDRKREGKKGLFMSSLNYSHFGKNGHKHKSYNKHSKRSREQMESLCLGSHFGNRVDLQESLRKASFNGTFFEKMKKFGKKRLQQGRTSESKKNLSIYLSHNNNNLRKRRLRSQKAQAHYVNAGNFLWNKRRRPPLGLNLTMVRKVPQEVAHSTLLENQRSTKGSLRLGKQPFSRGDIYRQLDEFERMKQQRVDLECKQLNSRGSRKSSAFRKKGDLIREIAEITQSLSCTSNLKKLTSKLQNKENRHADKLGHSDGLHSFYQERELHRRSTRHTKRRELGTLTSNLPKGNSRVN